jgi:hypothetical protein
LKAEQFIYGLFPGYGIRLVKSAGLTELLNGEVMDYLCQLGMRQHGKTEYSNLWPNGVVTVTKVRPASDEYGRSGVWNHTIAFRIVDLLAYVQPTKLLEPHFVERLEKPPQSLPSLDVE